MSRPARLVGAGTAAFAAGLGALAVLQHRAFWSGRFDVGNLAQAVWSTAHGDMLSVTGLDGPADLAARRALRPDRRRVRAALVAVAGRLAPARLPGRRGRDRRGAGLPPRQAPPRVGVGRGGLRARLPPAPGDAVARARRLPSRRARDPTPALGVLVPGRRSARRVRSRCRGRLPDEGADRARRRGDGALVRASTRKAARGGRDRRGRNDRLAARRGRRGATLRAGRRLALRGTLLRGGRVSRGHRRDGLHRPRRDRRGRHDRARRRLPARLAAAASRVCRCSHRSPR